MQGLSRMSSRLASLSSGYALVPRNSSRLLHSSPLFNMPLKVGDKDPSVGLFQRMTVNKVNITGAVAQVKNYGSIYEPDYLDERGPDIPMYDLLNLQIKGYDYPVLEKFAKYVHHTADRIGITVDESCPTPCKKLRITKLKPQTAVLECEYFLNQYERNVQISDVPATLLPVLINVIEASLPAGISLRIHPHLPEHTENRYVPDLQLKDLRSQLEEMKGEKR